MEGWSLTEYFLYGVIPLVILVAVLNPGFFVSLRQRWLVWLQAGHGHGHSHSAGSDGHGHSHSHAAGSEGHSHSHVPAPPSPAQGQRHDHGHGHTEGHTADPRKAEFQSLGAQTMSKVPSLKGKDSGIRILEIGIGAGANFKYFPEKCSLIAVDPNPQFEHKLKDNLSQFPGIRLERRLLCGAEDMSEIESGSVDAVVGTGVFCNINDVQKAFEEILRVLTPGGGFYYMDHYHEETPSFRNYFNAFLDATGLSKLLFNATLNRTIKTTIEHVGFSEVKQKTTGFKDHQLVIGVATK